MSDQEKRPNFIVRIWRWFWRLMTQPAARFGAGFLVLIGIAVGIIGWQSKMAIIEATSTTDFCMSCHEMEAFVMPAVAEGPHWNNASGVRAECKDCHVPKNYFAKMKVKINAGLVEVPGHLTGKIGTQEKYDAYRPVMAERVWERMAATDSRECRSCHAWETMSEEDQSRPAMMMHQRAQQQGQTCIDCHKGIAHGITPRQIQAARDSSE